MVSEWRQAGVVVCVLTMSSRCSASTSSECQSCLLMRMETLWSNEAARGEKAGEVGLDEAGVAAVEVGREVDMADSSEVWAAASRAEQADNSDNAASDVTWE